MRRMARVETPVRKIMVIMACTRNSNRWDGIGVLSECYAASSHRREEVAAKTTLSQQILENDNCEHSVKS